MGKLISINTCNDCPFFDSVVNLKTATWLCEKSHKEIEVVSYPEYDPLKNFPIPSWCELPDSQS